MRELVDKKLMLEDAKSWVAMDSYEQHLINNISAWIENLPTVEVSDGDCISRRMAIDALWKALYEYEDKTEKQFQESEDLDVGDWIEHRIFVQDMNDIDRQTILNLPSAQPERIWHSCKTPPKHHKDVLVRGTESIGNVTIYKVMQWDVDAWRPTNYTPSIIWEEWSEI